MLHLLGLLLKPEDSGTCRAGAGLPPVSSAVCMILKESFDSSTAELFNRRTGRARILASCLLRLYPLRGRDCLLLNDHNSHLIRVFCTSRALTKLSKNKGFLINSGEFQILIQNGSWFSLLNMVPNPLGGGGGRLLIV